MHKLTIRQLKSTAAAIALAAGALSLGACASEKYVNEHVAVVDSKVTTTQGQVADQQAQLQAQDAKLAQLDQTSRDALERAQAAGKAAEGKFVYTTVLSDDSIKFPARSAQLSAEAQTRLTDLVEKLKGDNKNVYLEIQGHADVTEAKAGAMTLGERRAEAVRMFMSKAGVPLNRMATISYGTKAPVATEKTRAAHAQNRRVTIVVLA